MAERIVPNPSLTAVATPVDRFVAPLRQQAAPSNTMLELGKALQSVNPAIQGYIQQRYTDKAQTEEAQGQLAESYIDPSVELEKNRQGWNEVINRQRQADKATGRNTADKLAAASPHFRRGIYKARAARLGRGLDDYLSMAYSRNPTLEYNGQTVQLHDVDDQAALQMWVQQQTNDYVERFGLNELDPVLVAEVFSPFAAAAQEKIAGTHTGLRLDRYQTEYLEEMSAGVGIALTSETGNSEADVFLRRLIGAESGGRRDVVNPLGYTGLFQFGAERLADFNRATGKSYTLADLKGEGSEARQHEVARWHIADIDATIDAEGFLDKGWSRDGLRAVAHLGGKGGMKQFVMTGGEYNPDDGYIHPKTGKKVKGTKLSDYYNRFASAAGELQDRMDAAVRDGVNPSKVNTAIVDGVITESITARDETMLDVLDQIDAGSGPLGNIGWVKQKVAAARDRITDLAYQDEQRERTRTAWEREETARSIMVDVFPNLINDPINYDPTEAYNAALASGNPELAKSIYTMQKSMAEDAYKITTDPVVFTDLRRRIAMTSDPRELNQIVLDASHYVNTGLLSASDFASLVDDRETRQRYANFFDNSEVNSEFRWLESTIKDRFAVLDENGFTTRGGYEESKMARDRAHSLFKNWLAKNPDATLPDAQEAAREIVNSIADDKRFVNTSPEAPTPQKMQQATPTIDIQNLEPATIEFFQTPDGAAKLGDLAKALGMSPNELGAKLGIFGNNTNDR